MEKSLSDKDSLEDKQLLSINKLPFFWPLFIPILFLLFYEYMLIVGIYESLTGNRKGIKPTYILIKIAWITKDY